MFVLALLLLLLLSECGGKPTRDANGQLPKNERVIGHVGAGHHGRDRKLERGCDEDEEGGGGAGAGGGGGGGGGGQGIHQRGLSNSSLDNLHGDDAIQKSHGCPTRFRFVFCFVGEKIAWLNCQLLGYH